jgi:hypothetical protein
MDGSSLGTKKQFIASISAWSFDQCTEFLKMPTTTKGRKIPKDLTPTEAQVLVLARMNELHARAINEQTNQMVLMGVLTNYRWLMERVYGQGVVQQQLPFVRFGNGFELNQDLVNLRNQLSLLVLQQQQQQQQQQPRGKTFQTLDEYISNNNSDNVQEENSRVQVAAEEQTEEQTEVQHVPRVVTVLHDIDRVKISEGFEFFKRNAKKPQQRKQREEEKKYKEEEDEDSM